MAPNSNSTNGSTRGSVEACLSSSSLTASLPGETHTLGNVLRSLLIRNPEVEFAGYSVPHPTSVEMNLRIQTSGWSLHDSFELALDINGMTGDILCYGVCSGTPAVAALEQALVDLESICVELDRKYDAALEKFGQVHTSKLEKS